MTTLQAKAKRYTMLALCESMAHLATALHGAGVKVAKLAGKVHHAADLERVWVSADGTATPFSRLKTSHRRNILRKLEREGKGGSELYHAVRNTTP